MTRIIKLKNIYKLLRLTTLALLITVLYSVNVHADVLECSPGTTNKEVAGKGTYPATTPDCPNGKTSRNDINVNCIANQAANNCIDIMPAQNKNQVARIPEDVCFRNEGWSNKRNHNGMDYALPQGAGVIAAADGIVETAGSRCSTGTGGNGIHVIIRHEMTAPQSSDDGAIVPSGHTQCFRTYYLHLSKLAVSAGQRVTKGTKIGEVGGTGCRGGRIDVVYPVHLHFEMRTCGGAIINPMCPGLGDLCPGNTTTDENGETSSAFDPDKCRDCVANAAQCNASYVGGAGGDAGSGSMYHELVASGRKCSISDYKNSFTTCVFCKVFRILFDTASIVAAKSFASLSPAVSAVVIILTAIWLSFTILKYIGSFEVKEPRTMIKEILNKIIIVLFVLAILAVGPATFFHFTIEPIFNTGMRLAILTSSNSDMVNCDDFEVLTMEKGGGLPESMGKNILCVIKTIQDSFLDILALGSTAICIALFEQSFWHIPIFPHFGYLLTGLALWISAMLVLIIYPWLLVDAVLKLSVAVSLLPAAIGAFAFENLKKYTAKVWETFMNSMFNFVFLSIILFVLISMIDDTIDKADVRDLMTDDLNPESLLSKIGWWTTTFLQICFAIILGWAVLGEGSDFANDFAGGGLGFSQNIGSRVGATAMSGAKGVALPAAKAAGKAGKQLGKAVGETVKEKANAAKINRQAKSIMNSKHSVKDANGNMTQSYTTWSGKKVTRTLNVDANGNKSITKSSTDKKGNETTTTSDKFMSVSSTKDKNGNVVKEDFQMKAAGAKHLINKDGTVNQVAVNAMTQNSLHGAETVQKAIAVQMIKERFGEEQGLSKNFDSRNVTIGKDENGNSVVQIEQKNKSGVTQKATMTLGGKRAMIEIETISKDGRRSSKIASDGVFKKTEEALYDKEGNMIKGDMKMDIVDEYKQGKPIDALGTFSKKIQESGTLFSQNDLNHIRDYHKKYGYVNKVDGVKR
ncbi:MAG: M23 family metallopeptidase [Lactobacillaceae bacterium]|nr:M23 family metallopeptidase [Lactobacillaceae bacterium]